MPIKVCVCARAHCIMCMGVAVRPSEEVNSEDVAFLQPLHVAT